MGVFEQFPYANMHEMNLDWLLKKMKELAQAMETFKATESLKFADPIIWSINTQYEKSTIVIDSAGNAYLSLQPVPDGVQLNNDEYWLEIFNFTDYTRTANKNLTDHVENNTTVASHNYSTDDWLIWNDVLYRVTSAIAIDDALIVAPAAGSNIVHFTVEDFCKAWISTMQQNYDGFTTNIVNTVNQYYTDTVAQIDRIIAGSTDGSEVIDARETTDTIAATTLKSAINNQIKGIVYSQKMHKFYPKWNRQNIDSNMNIITATNRCLTDVFSGGILKIEIDPAARINIVHCDSSGTPLEKSGNIITSPFYCASSDYVRILMSRTDNASIGIDDANALISIYTVQAESLYKDNLDIDLNDLKYNYYPSWTREAYDSNNNIIASTTRCLSAPIKCSAVAVTVAPDFDIIPVWTDENGNIIGREQNWLPSGNYIFKGITDYIRLVVRRTNNASLPTYAMLTALDIKVFSSFSDKCIGSIDLINELNAINPLLSFTGGAIGNDGQPTAPTSTRAISNPITTDYIRVDLIDTDYKYQIVAYDNTNAMIFKSSGWQTDPTIFNLHGCHIYVVVAKTNDSKLTAAEAKNAVSVICSLDNDYYPEYKSDDSQNFLDAGSQIEHINITQLRVPNTYSNVPFAAFTANGVLIVGCDSRQGTGDDTEPIDVLVTRSLDRGQTFEPAQTLFTHGNNAANSRVNDCTILATKSGRVFVFAHWCDSDVQWQIMNSDTYNADRADFDLIYKYSDDDGHTWSNAISLQSLYFSNPDIMTILGGLTAGIETESGMLIVGISCKMKTSNTDISGDMFRYQSTFMYSTDNGVTWTLHNSLTPCNALEPTIIEYAPNKFVMNCRGYISARRMFTFEYDPDTQTFSDIILAKGDCVIPEPTGHYGAFYKFKYGYRAVGLYGGSLGSGNDRGKQAVVATYDYAHFTPVIPIRNVADSRYGMMCYASYKGHLVVAYANAGYIFIADLDRFIELIYSI